MGLAADEDASVSRWIFAPLSALELRALALGGVATRDVFLKATVHVVDFDVNGEPQAFWRCSGESLSDDSLPIRGARLPKACQVELSAYAPQNSDKEIQFLQAKSSDGVLFRAISDVLSTFQRLWNALAQGLDTAVPRERSALALAAATMGSLVLRIEAVDEGVFQAVAGRFEQLAAADDDPDALASVLSKFGPRVQARYQELLVDIQKHELEMLYRSDRGAALLSANIASKVLVSLHPSMSSEPKLIAAVGYFAAYDIANATFDFVDEERERRFQGKVQPTVVNAFDRVVVGPGSKYAVVIDEFEQIAASGGTRLRWELRVIVDNTLSV